MKEKSVTEIVQDVCEDMCEHYCKFSDKAETDDDLKVCDRCPLNKLY